MSLDRTSLLRLATALVALAVTISASRAGAAEITGREIAQLREELAEAREISSSTRVRRAYKGIVRDAQRLLERSPGDPQRFIVLDLVLQSQKRLVAIDNSGENRQALLDTCALLAEAPDEVADLRLEADLLLSERSLSEKNADVAERADALAKLVERYRDTPGEAKSLMYASQIAPKLEAFDLEMQILRAMQERFADDHGVIEFRRKSLAAGRIEALFRREFERADGTTISFPVDRLGVPCIMVFWSAKTKGFDVALGQIDEYQKQFPGRFDVFSLNLDELPDAGQAKLRSLGLEWTALRLPGGKLSQTFRTYGRREPVSILVNAYGYTLLTPTNHYGNGHGGGEVNPYKFDDVRITDQRYLAQLQSLFVGDFLAGTVGDDASRELEGSLGAILDCLVKPPFRYRLSGEEALANYTRAAELCREASEEQAPGTGGWQVNNLHILALLGRWKLAGEPAFLNQAAELAGEVLNSKLPAGAEVIAQFCLAKQALRQPGGDAESILEAFLEATGETDRALAAAAILALDGNSRELHERYRRLLLGRPTVDPTLWPVTSFLRDRYHRLDLLKVKLSRGERRIRSRYGELVSPREHAINHDLEAMTEKLPGIELQSLDGSPLNLPTQGAGKLTLLLFLEPPAEPEADFPVTLDKKGEPTTNDPLRQVMRYAAEFAERHVHGEVEVIAAFLCDDADRVRKLMDRNGWSCTPAIVPGALKNPMVRQLGIVSADRIPNVFLLRRDGTVAWHTSGFAYKSDFGYPFAVRLAMKVHIEVCDSELAFRALERGDFAEAKRVFSGPFLPEKDERYRWRAPRFHGRALASMGLGEWPAALEDIDTAIEAHRKEFDRKEDEPGESLLILLRTKAAILDQLGRGEEAGGVRDLASAAASPYPITIYDRFHRRLETLRRKDG